MLLSFVIRVPNIWRESKEFRLHHIAPGEGEKISPGIELSLHNMSHNSAHVSSGVKTAFCIISAHI